MPHRLRAGDTDEHVLEQRAEVKSNWAKIDRFLERFGRVFLAVAVAASTWFMSHVVAPLKEVPSLVSHQQWQDSVSNIRQAKNDSVVTSINSQLREGSDQRSKMVDILGALAALQCEQFTPREKLTSKLCNKITIGVLP